MGSKIKDNELFHNWESIEERREDTAYAIRKSNTEIIMNDKDYKKLVKDYEKLHSTRPDLYILDYKDGFLSRNEKVKNEKFLQRSEEEKIRTLLAWLGLNSGYYKFKYYEAFKNRDMAMLDNALYETAIIEHLDCVTDPGYDHAFFAFRVIPQILAANIPERIEKLIPLENGPANNGYSAGPCIVNLLMAIWCENEELRGIAMEQAEKFLNRKITLLEKGFIDSYLGFLKKNPQMINEGLVELCQGGKKNRDSTEDAFTRGFCVEAHGMYNLAHWAYNGELEKDIVMPDEPNFCQDLANYQMDRGYKHGDLYSEYPENLEIYNTILKANPPVMHLTPPVRKKSNLDAKRFETELIEEIISNI